MDSIEHTEFCERQESEDKTTISLPDSLDHLIKLNNETIPVYRMNFYRDFLPFLESDLGFHFPKIKYNELIKTLVMQLNLQTDIELKTYIRNMVVDMTFRNVHKEKLIEILNIEETYFFRHGSGFNELEHTILPKLINSEEGKGSTFFAKIPLKQQSKAA